MVSYSDKLFIVFATGTVYVITIVHYLLQGLHELFKYYSFIFVCFTYAKGLVNI